MRRFVLLGCDHLSANLEEVARTRLPEENLAETLAALRDRLQLLELVYLSTCHRTEFYAVYDGELCPGRLAMQLAIALPSLTHGASTLPPVDHCLAAHGGEVARHLFRVSSALEALMVGESQVLGQVKNAFRLCHETGVVGPRLTTLFNQAFRTAKRVRTETALSRRPVSLVSLAERSLRGRLAKDTRAVAVIGAGEMAALALELTRKIDERRELVVFNRGWERGSALADRFGATFRPLAEFPPDGTQFAAVVTATSAAVPTIDAALAHRLAPTFILDLGTPANVDPAVAEIDGIELATQANLRDEAEANRSARGDELEKAEAIVEEQLRELSYEVMEHELSPVARQLVTAFREVARNEIQRIVSGNGHLSEEALIAEAADRISQRLVRLPMRGLREVAWQHSTDVLHTFLAAVQE